MFKSEDSKLGGGDMTQNQPCPILSTRLTILVSQEQRTPTEQHSQSNTQVLHQRGFEFIRHTVGRIARKQCVLPKALDHISHALCALPTTSTGRNRYRSFDVPACYYITSYQSIDRDSGGKQYTLHIKTPTPEPQRTKRSAR